MEQGTKYNDNGITWIREYCEQAIPSIKDMSLRVEFLDEDRTEICGHGETGIEDGLPLFENAEVIGHCTGGRIDTIQDEDGNDILVMLADGYLDEMCYKSFVEKLETDINNGNAPYGSVEIFRTNNNDGIVYKYGYKDKGRIPTEFEYSGFALLGVTPADKQSKIIEMNNKEEYGDMTENEIKAVVEQTVNAMTVKTNELNELKEECNAKIAEANELVKTTNEAKDLAEASAAKIQEAYDQCSKELGETYTKLDNLYNEMSELRKALAEAQAKERINELNSAIAEFSEEEKNFATEEIATFTADPVSTEINTVLNKIWEGIGKKAKAENDAKVIAEQNSAKKQIEDIFSEMVNQDQQLEDSNIF